jgi:multiple sugar transport system ATP-binding protein
MDLYHHPANLFAARFIGTPGMNLLDAHVTAISEQGVEVELQGQRLHADVSPDGLTSGESVTLGIRPEHVVCGHGGQLQALVTHVEALGEHSVLYLALPGVTAPLLAKTLSESVAVGNMMPLNFPRHALHVFRADGQAQPRKRAG